MLFITLIMRIYLALLLSFTLACGSSSSTSDDSVGDSAETSGAEDPTVETLAEPPVSDGAPTCTSNDDCAEGEMCTGPAGCDVVWTCVPREPCTRDWVLYCLCDGTEQGGSGSCPPAPYAARGECP